MPISLYRKWRPQKFSQVVNQAVIIKTLTGALENNQISHAYLFAGPRGTGKTTIARLLAKAVNCPQRKNFEPCNKCQSCQEISAGRSLDIFEVDAASHRGIDEIRDLIEKIKFTPSRAKYKVFVIDEVHMLTKEAFNALLKTLEEPPTHVIFILATTEAYKVPPTILSRCQRFDFKRIEASAIQGQIERVCQQEMIKIEPAVSQIIAQNSEGSLRDALGFLDQLRALTKNKITTQDAEYILGLTSQKAVLKFLNLIFSKKTKEAVELVNSIFEKGYELSQFIKLTIEEIRKIMLAKSGINSTDLNLDEEEKVKINQWLEIVSLRDLIMMIKALKEAEDYLKLSSLPQLALEMAIIEIIKPKDKENLNSIDLKSDKRNPRPIEISNIQKKHHLIQKKKIKSSKIQKNPSPKIKTSKNTSIDKIIELWPKMIEEIKKENSSLSALLKMCVPIDFKDSKIILGAKFKLHAEKIKDKKQAIEDALIRTYQQEYSVECQMVSNQNNDIYQQNLAKIIDQEQNQEDNLTKDALEVFGN